MRERARCGNIQVSKMTAQRKFTWKTSGHNTTLTASKWGAVATTTPVVFEEQHTTCFTPRSTNQHPSHPIPGGTVFETPIRLVYLYTRPSHPNQPSHAAALQLAVSNRSVMLVVCNFAHGRFWTTELHNWQPSSIAPHHTNTRKRARTRLYGIHTRAHTHNSRNTHHILHHALMYEPFFFSAHNKFTIIPTLRLLNPAPFPLPSICWVLSVVGAAQHVVVNETKP
jgi:hypothetical protein